MKNCLLLSRHQQEPHWPSKSYKAVSINLQKKDSLHINLSKLKVYSKFTETFIIYLWKSFPLSILKFNTFLSISTSTRYQSVGYTYHTGTWSADRPWPVAGECWGTQGIAPATTGGKFGYYTCTVNQVLFMLAKNFRFTGTSSLWICFGGN